MGKAQSDHVCVCVACYMSEGGQVTAAVRIRGLINVLCNWTPSSASRIEIMLRCVIFDSWNIPDSQNESINAGHRIFQPKLAPHVCH